MPTAELDVLDSPERAALVLDPLRIQILERLREPGSATSVAAELQLPRQRVGYHVKELEKAGLLQLVGEQRRGNCTERLLRASARHYLVAPQALGGLGADARTAADRMSSTYLLGVAAQAIRDVSSLRSAAAHARKQLPTFTLETEVRFANVADQNAFAEELATAVASLVAKFHSPEPGARPFRFFVGGHPSPAPPSPQRRSDHVA
jgi:DNA-binding transcriptional ArsR family regulator